MRLDAMQARPNESTKLSKANERRRMIHWSTRRRGAALFILICLVGCFQSSAEPSSATSSSSSVTSSAGSSTGASGSSTGGNSAGPDAGCSSATSLQDNDLTKCTTDRDCGCPLTCVVDPSFGFGVCQRPCAKLDDCPSLSTWCNGAACVAVPCSSLDVPCEFETGVLGNCLPPSLLLAWPASTTGLCTQTGAENGVESCIPGASRAAGPHLFDRRHGVAQLLDPVCFVLCHQAQCEPHRADHENYMDLGCTSGGAGVFGLLGLIPLVAARRR